MFQAFFFGPSSPTKEKDEQRLLTASPPPLEDGSGPLGAPASSASGTVVLRANPKQQLTKIVDTENRTMAEVALGDAGDDASSSMGAGGKEPLVESLLNMDGKALSPHRLMQAAKCVVICSLYMVVGPTLILLNKHILKDLDDGKGFNFPMFLSCLGVICSAITSHLIVRVGGWKLQYQDKMKDWGFYMKNVVPIALCFALTLPLGNLAYVFLSVSFIQMLKAFTPAIVMVVAFLFGVETPDSKIIMSVLGICAGTALASYGEINFSVLGILIMLAAEVTEAVRLVLVQFLLKSLKFSVVEGQYFLAPCSAAALFSASILFEFPTIRRTGAWAQVAAHPFLFLAAGLLGVGANFVAFMVVQATNSVTLKVLGTARNAMLVLASVYVFGEVVTGTQFVGYAASLSAFTVYSYLKSRKM